MKKVISKLISIISFLILIVGYSFSQQNLYKPANDTVKANGTFYDPITNNITRVDYLKHFLSIQLKVGRMTESSYITDFYSFLKTQNAILRNPEIDRHGLVTVRLSDTSNAVYYIKRFYDSDLFEYVYPSGYGKEDN